MVVSVGVPTPSVRGILGPAAVARPGVRVLLLSVIVSVEKVPETEYIVMYPAAVPAAHEPEERVMLLMIPVALETAPVTVYPVVNTTDPDEKLSLCS